MLLNAISPTSCPQLESLNPRQHLVIKCSWLRQRHQLFSPWTFQGNRGMIKSCFVKKNLPSRWLYLIFELWPPLQFLESIRSLLLTFSLAGSDYHLPTGFPTTIRSQLQLMGGRKIAFLCRLLETWLSFQLNLLWCLVELLSRVR